MNPIHRNPPASQVNGAHVAAPDDDDDPWAEDEQAPPGRVGVETDCPFAIVPGWLLTAKRLSRSAKHVYAILALHAGGNTRIGYMALSRLAKAAGMSVRTFQRALRDLESFGAVTTRARFKDTPQGSRQTSSVYRVHRVRQEGARVSPVSPPPVSPVSPLYPDQSGRNQNAPYGAPEHSSGQRSAEPERKPRTRRQAENQAAPWPKGPDGQEITQVRLVELFAVRYEQELGVPYEPARNDYPLASVGLRKFPLEEIDARIARMFELATGTSDYWRRRCSVSAVFQCWRELGVDAAPEPERREWRGGAR